MSDRQVISLRDLPNEVKRYRHAQKISSMPSEGGNEIVDLSNLIRDGLYKVTVSTVRLDYLSAGGTNSVTKRAYAWSVSDAIGSMIEEITGELVSVNSGIGSVLVTAQTNNAYDLKFENMENVNVDVYFTVENIIPQHILDIQ